MTKRWQRRRTMLAYQVVDFDADPELREVPTPEPGPGQVLVRVGGAGACHSDLHVMKGRLGGELPFTLGHENAGWVAAIGAGVDGLDEGDAVAVYGAWGCGHCYRCRLTEENHCERATPRTAHGGGLGPDGGVAEYMLVPQARWLIPIGDLDPVIAAPMTDAALTPYSAIKHALRALHPGATALVIGAGGGLGHVAVQLLRTLTPARIVGVDTNDRKLALARTSGCDDVVAFDATTADALLELTKGAGAQLVLDMVGADATIALAATCCSANGEIALIGLGGGSIELRFGLLQYGARVRTPFWGSAVELAEVLQLARDGRVTPIVERFDLADASDAYARLRDGRLAGRAVIVPNTSKE
jgi:propanol-preferring alcohol dehydrogenase